MRGRSGSGFLTEVLPRRYTMDLRRRAYVWLWLGVIVVVASIGLLVTLSIATMQVTHRSNTSHVIDLKSAEAGDIVVIRSSVSRASDKVYVFLGEANGKLHLTRFGSKFIVKDLDEIQSQNRGVTIFDAREASYAEQLLRDIAKRESAVETDE